MNTQSLIQFIRQVYQTDDNIPLHEPRFLGHEKIYTNQCIDSTFVSSVGEYVNRFEDEFASFIGSRHAIAVVNGTQALFLALKLVGVEKDDEIITQSLTFIATANAISYLGAKPVFIDVDRDTLGLSPDALVQFLESNVIRSKDGLLNRKTGVRIAACLPMHTLGHPCRIKELEQICKAWGLPLIEDAAESVGSLYDGQHTGTFGCLGVFSFNGNKIITTGGGGIIATNSEELAFKAKHLATTAKQPHPWEFKHDMIGYNFRLPNINAALGVAQLEMLPFFIEKKRELAHKYREFCSREGYQFIAEPTKTRSNYWLNAILLNDLKEKEQFLKETNDNGIMTRPLWTPMHMLSMYRKYQTDLLQETEYLAERVVNFPSSVPIQ